MLFSILNLQQTSFGVGQLWGAALQISKSESIVVETYDLP